MKIAFKEFRLEDVPLYYEWAEKEHVKNVWFLEGYQPKEYILTKIKGNGIEYPFLITIDDKAIGFIQYWDIYARDRIEKNKKDYFTGSPPGTYGIDIFIGELDFIGKGFGSQILVSFSELLFKEYGAKKLVVDPDSENIKAKCCYEKAGFKLIGKGKDHVVGSVSIMEKLKS